MFYGYGPLSIRGQARAFRQGEILKHFLDFGEKFWSQFWIFLYVLYIETSPSAQNREKWARLGRLFLPNRPLGWTLSIFGPRQANLCLWAFRHDKFNRPCPAIQRGEGSGFLSEGTSSLTACMSEQRRFWRDCADAQARLNLRCSHRR